MTSKNQHHIETLQEIRSMMERSSRFISLSGLSGVSAGVAALLGAAIAYLYLETTPFQIYPGYYVVETNYTKWGLSYHLFFPLLAFAVLLLALIGGIYFTSRKARSNKQPIWDALTRRLLTNLFIPLAAGGLFCLALIYHGLIGLIAPSMLVFYGLALINASKYTLHDIRYLGYSEIVLGVLGLFFLGYGLDLWAIGFGLLHIIYGTMMYYKYESNTKAA